MSDVEPSVETRAGQELLKARRVRPRPAPDELTQPFWDGARAGELRVQRCDGCGRFRHPPTPTCPTCASTTFVWPVLSGAGEIYSFIVDHRLMVPGFDEPYVVAQVVPVEADADTVRLTANIRECAIDAVRIGMPVRVVFERLDEEFTLPQFVPDAPAD